MLLLNSFLLATASLTTLTNASTFTNPIRRPGPDPSLVFADGSYHLTYTSYNSITITHSPTLSGLLTSSPKTVWTDTNSTRNANMWAPEIHHIDDIWYIFYSSCDSSLPCCDSCQTRVLRGCNASNPSDCAYSFLATLVPPVGTQGGPGKDFAFSIDGTYLDIPGTGRYHVLSALDEDSLQAIMITELDTETWGVKGWNVISSPDQAWEMNTTNAGNPNAIVAVNEGPHPLYHNDSVWLSYSGSYCGTPNYALGLLRWNGGNPLLKTSWEKSGPVLSQANGNYGTGHNAFFNSPDGTQIWNIFHATSNAGGSCGSDRYTMTQLVNFDSNNLPTFDQPALLGSVLAAPSGEV